MMRLTILLVLLSTLFGSPSLAEEEETLCAELARHDVEGTSQLSEQAASRLRAQSPLLKNYREILTNLRISPPDLRLDSPCRAELLNNDLILYHISGILPRAFSFSPDATYNPHGAMASMMMSERSPYSKDEERRILDDSVRLLLPEAVVHYVITLQENSRLRNVICSLALSKLPRRIADAIRTKGRCASYEPVDTEELINGVVARLPEDERQFCARRGYESYRCLMAATWARSLCNGEVLFNARRYRLALCETLDEVSPRLVEFP